MARKPHLRSVAAASAAVSPAPSAAQGAALAPASPPAPARPRRRALLGPRPLIDGEDATNYDVILKRISAAVAPVDFVEGGFCQNELILEFSTKSMPAGFSCGGGLRGSPLGTPFYCATLEQQQT